MEVQKINVPNKTLFIEHFEDESPNLARFFDFWNDESYLEQRIEYVSQRTYARKELAAIIRKYMMKDTISDKAVLHLKALEENALVVIGGQQAGLLTGPMYSFHKAISVILLAKKYSTQLNKQVVPVFWIAGEDHDLDEVNHVNNLQSGNIKKTMYVDNSLNKLMASNVTLKEEKIQSFIEQVFQTMPETIYTKKLFEKVMTIAKKATSFSDFFYLQMNDLFKEEGLLFIDAAYPELRNLQSDYFSEMIENAEEINRQVVSVEKIFEEMGYGKPIALEEDNANLFYVEDGQRYLLRLKDGRFVHEANNISFSKEELSNIAKQTPEKLSNNVVTRPIMQELLFPTLTFVGGTSEIAYWGILHDAFSYLNMKMPLMHVRNGMTYVTRKTQRYLNMWELTVEDVWNGNLNNIRHDIIEEKMPLDALKMIDEMKTKLFESYTELHEKNSYIDKKIINKNMSKHAAQFNYLSRKIEDDVLRQNDPLLSKIKYLEQWLYPNSGLQERVYHPFYLLNEVGEDFVAKLLSKSELVEQAHSVVYE